MYQKHIFVIYILIIIYFDGFVKTLSEFFDIIELFFDISTIYSLYLNRVNIILMAWYNNTIINIYVKK